jgi:uncharacterized protein YkwD
VDPGVEGTPDSTARAAASPQDSQEPLPELIPARPPGTEIRVELLEEPALRYEAAQPTETDAHYAKVVESLGRPNLVYDAGLGRAAGELAYQHSVLGGLVPSDVVDFLLRSAGAVDRTVMQGYTRTSGDDMTAVRERLIQLIGASGGDRGLRRIGIGEAYVPGAAAPRYIAILLSERQVEVSPVARRVQPGVSWVLSGVLPSGYRDARALVLRDDGRLESIPVAHETRRFSLRVPTDASERGFEISLMAEGPHGSTPLLQLPVSVGAEPPRVLDTHLPPDESAVTNSRIAEVRAFQLLNLDRTRFGLEPLERDLVLDRVAREHSQDMRQNRFFGHFSMESGSPGDRLALAAYRAATYGENVARGGSIYGAQKGLLHSLGHRRNILNRSFTHVGIGVVGETVNGQVRWYLTQLFSLPAAAVDAGSLTTAVVARLNRDRAAEHRAPLHRHGRLEEIAVRAAHTLAAGGSEGVAEAVLARAREAGLTKGGAYAWGAATTDPEALELPAQARDPAHQYVGVGVVQFEDHPNGLVGVVLIFTGAVD